MSHRDRSPGRGCRALLVGLLLSQLACPGPEARVEPVEAPPVSVWFRQDAAGSVPVSLDDVVLSGFAITGKAPDPGSAVVELRSRGETIATLAAPAGQTASGLLPDLLVRGPVELAVSGRADVSLFLRVAPAPTAPER